MAYDDPRFRAESAYRDESEPGQRGGDQAMAGYGSAGYDPGPGEEDGYGAEGYESSTSSGTRSPVTPTQLSNVFDDPHHGEPGRDRVAVHLLWEIVLLLFSTTLFFLLRESAPAALRGTALKEMLLFATVIGLMTVGAGLTLRAAVPNLALGTVGYACATFFAQNSHRGMTTTALMTLAVALAAGAALAAVVVGFQVPSWAASLGLTLAVIVWLQDRHDVNVVNGAYQPNRHAMYWFAGFAGVAVLGGLLGLIRPVRRLVGRYRPIGDPADRRGGAAAAVVVVVLVASTVLAGAAGILLALSSRRIPAGDPAGGLGFTGLALGAALLGGTSAFGRRGGVFGTVFAVVLLVALMRYADAQRWNLSSLAVGAAAIAAGLVVTRLVEAFGRPRIDPVAEGYPDEEVDQAEWTSTTAPANGGEGWSSGSTSGGWTAQLPARTTGDGWGGGDRWNRR